MFVELVDKIGGKPMRLEASQVLVRNGQGTAICVAGEYGPAGTVSVAHAGDREFNRVLAAFGYKELSTIVHELPSRLPPAGASLLRRPTGF